MGPKSNCPESPAEKALATLQLRSIPGLQPAVPLVLSPYPPTTPPTPMPLPSAIPRLVKHLPPGYTDSQLYDLFRPFGALASARVQAGFGIDTGMIEFWREEEAALGEEALHCADVEGQNIAVQVYQPKRASTGASEFSPTAPAFVPSGSIFPYPSQVCLQIMKRESTLIPYVVLPSTRLPLLPSCTSAIRPWPRSTGPARTADGTWLK